MQTNMQIVCMSGGGVGFEEALTFKHIRLNFILPSWDEWYTLKLLAQDKYGDSWGSDLYYLWSNLGSVRPPDLYQMLAWEAI